MKKIRAIGLMSGTSLDGLDVAYVEIVEDKGYSVKVLNFETYNFDNTFKEKVFKSFSQNITSRFLSSLNFEIANVFADKVNHFIEKYQIKRKEIAFIASHGQTIYHLPDPDEQEFKSTLQLGDISVIAQKCKLTTIGDFRTADVAQGGQGAPLVGIFDKLVLSSQAENRILQNIGGIANATFLGSQKTLSFDTGPGNVLIDTITKKLFHKSYDKDSEIALQGSIDQEVLDYLKNDEYIYKTPPKSTGREKYNNEYFEKVLTKFKHKSPYDLVTTASYFVVYSILDNYKRFIFDYKVDAVYLSGGGALNPFVFNNLRDGLAKHGINLYKIEKLGISSESKEAAAFAFIGFLTLNKIHGNLPEATGANDSCILGKIAFYK
ncbi:anhydro-N-acetylmuramic acid kinase [Mycoplasma sp. Ms02]|uniref:anhydro-N-acetylmuramic acid kinase n=1 Tax=Mycoplasma sp. Ms02 TaxID=353851 RepID=UPI001C8AB9A8|nr:anhydro-N-acetylmuramic acid kinase [Mycoplasma sp. Ms02]QZE12308.1 anhydro-N-acetylmuramic acid kinase [Mycoplasma sp. Ms02]